MALPKNSKLKDFNYFKWFLLIPSILVSFSALTGTLTWLPEKLRSLEQMEKEHTQLMIKNYGATADDLDGMRASVQREIEVDKIIDDAEVLIPIAQEFYNHGLRDLKKEIKENTEDIVIIKKKLTGD